MKLYGILGIFCAVMLFAAADTHAQVDPKADKLVKHARDKFYAFQDFSANIVFTLENKALKEKQPAKSGYVKVKKSKYRIVFSDQELFCDGKTVWVYLKNNQEVNVSDFDPNESLSIDRVFALYDKGMNSRLDKPEVIGGLNTQKISLFPRDAKTEYIRIEVWINPATDLVHRFKLINRNGTTYQYDISGIKTNTLVPDSEFVFDAQKYPKVNIVDLRWKLARGFDG